jgi:S1-C subfamily serine protease
MSGRTLYKFAGVALILILALSAFSLVAAQGTTTTGDQPFLGITVGPDTAGARVLSVLSGSPAEQAGLKVGDVITNFADTKVTADSLAQVVQGHKVNDQVKITVLRNGSSIDLNATLGARPQAVQPSTQTTPQATTQPRPFLGVSLADATNGAAIQQIQPNSPAANAGLAQGDIITAVNGAKVASAQEVVQAIGALKPGDKVTLDILHNNASKAVDVTLGTTTAAVVPGSGPLGRGQFNFPFGRSFQFGNNGLGLSYDGQNLTITTLSQDNPLYTAGLRQGDVITAINGQPVGPQTLMNLLRTLNADSTIKFTVQRNGQSQDIDVPASALQGLGGFGFNFGVPGRGNGFPINPFGFGFGFGGGARLGVQFVMLDEQTAKQYNVTATQGALVLDVVANSPAATAGLQKNDIITAVNGDVLDAKRPLNYRLLPYQPGDKVTLDILRNGQKQQITVTMGQPEQSGGVFPFNDDNGFQFQFPVPAQPPQPNTQNNQRL